MFSEVHLVQIKNLFTFWKIVVVCLFWSEMSLGFERYQEVLRLARRNKFLGVKGFCFYYILKAISWAQHNIEELPPPVVTGLPRTK